MITVLCGGVGAARFLTGLTLAVDPTEVTGIVNVGDDSVIHGLHISPDLDTITYTLAGSMNTETGWGLRDETWNAMEMLRFYGRGNGIDPSDPVRGEAAGWFSLGDRDLGTHLYRTSRLSTGARLSEVTAEITRAWGLGPRLLPVTDDPLNTILECPDGTELAFQEYFVREQHDVPISGIRFDGANDCTPADGVMEAIAGAETLCIAPSNPLISIDPLLAVPGVREAVKEVRDRSVAISPIVGGAAIKGPADRLMTELGLEPSVVSVAEIYSDLVSVLVIDQTDGHLRAEVESRGVRCVVTDTVMSTPDVATLLARTCLEAVNGNG